ncbi:MAG: glycosyltransferase family 4 protein [Lutibacter sp.]|nr:glycosyltransferase family 4 protein [Lutibacter sp.]MBP9601526.1 glycosyltransferase family 4 protein [Lutibacter sp.]
MKKLLIIGFVWPEPNSTAAGTRMMQLIELFKKSNYSIYFACTASKTSNSHNLTNLAIQEIEITLNNSNFDTFIAELNPDIVLFDRYLTEEQFGWRVDEFSPNTLKILDTEDLHFLRKARHTAFKNNSEVSLNVLINETTKREIASIYRCDLTLIISEFEHQLLVNQFKIDASILHYIPFLLDEVCKETIHSYPTFKERTHFITIGNFKHEPNFQAVLYLKQVIWPLIRKQLPQAQLHIYGAYATEKATQLNNAKEGFIIKGWCENLKTTFINAKVCLAPLQFGAGLKGKLIDAMLYGTPSVTTTIGAEAMHENLPWNGFIENNPEKFADAAVELYLNEEKWTNFQQNGIEIINKCYSKLKHETDFINRIDEVFENLNSHRLSNFNGLMLQYHANKSTKYMSKWIEEKNKIT